MRDYYIKFTKELTRRGYGRADIRRLLAYIRPFFEYLDTATANTSTGTVTPGHVCAYVAQVKSACPAGTSMEAVLEANNRLVAVRMFCLQMFVAGYLPHDYSNGIDYIDLPKSDPASLSNG